MINKHSSDAIQPKKKATYADMEATMIDKLTESAPDKEIIAVRQKDEQENPMIKIPGIPTDGWLTDIFSPRKDD